MRSIVAIHNMDFLSRIEARRRLNYGLDSPRLTEPEEALAFIDRVGLCLLSPHETLELPALIPITIGRTRIWRDEWFTSRQVYYGQRFQGRAGFISVSLLPALYALSPTAEYHGDRFALYEHDFLSAEANQLVGALLSRGTPVTTRDLRRLMGLAADSARYQFNKALEEAESQFLIVKIGSHSDGDSNYTYIWDSFARAWPEVVEQGTAMSHEAAGLLVIRRYLQTVVAATLDQISEALDVSEAFVTYFLEKMEADGDLAREIVDARTYWHLIASPRPDNDSPSPADS